MLPENIIASILPIKARIRFGLAVRGWDRETAVERIVSAAVFILPLIAYIRTLAPTVYSLDSAELTIAAATGGLMRATGYPLYLLLGRIWSLIPIGDAGYRMNLFSAVCGAIGVWLAYRIMRRIGSGRLAAAGAAGLLGAAPYYWSLSLIAEVYTLQVALMGVLLLLLLRWAEEPTASRLAAAAGWTGLCMGHHLATLLLLPGIAVYVLSRGGRAVFRPAHLFGAAGAFLLGLSIYLYLPYLYAGDPAFNYAGRFDRTLEFDPLNLQSATGMWWLVSGQSFASRMFAYDGAAFWNEVGDYLALLGRAFVFAGILPGLLGFAALLKRDLRLAAALAAMFLLSAYFFIDYAVVDKDTMFLPTYFIWAIFAGLGYQVLIDRLGAVKAAWPRPVLQSAVLGLVILAAAVTWPGVDLSSDRAPRQNAEEILEKVGPDAVIFGWWGTVPPVQYLQIIEGRRPDVTIVNRFLISRESMYFFIQQEIDDRPIYIDDVPEEWRFVFKAVDIGHLYRLERIVLLEEKELLGGW